eukprot:g5844.t1
MGNLCSSRSVKATCTEYEKKIANSAWQYAGRLDGGMELSRILLSFNRVKDGCVHLRNEFREIDQNHDHKISLVELKATTKLSSLSQAQVEEFFKESDHDMSHDITFSEFVVFYAYGFFLVSNKNVEMPMSPRTQKKESEKRMSEEIIASEEMSSGKIDPEEFSRRMHRLRSTTAMSGLKEQEKDIGKLALRKMFEVISSAWRLFDVDNDGILTIDELQGRLHENLSHKSKKHAPSQHSHSGFFDRSRFEEMDLNKNGSVTFPEFLGAFVRWACEEIIEEEEEEEKTAEVRAPSST